MVERVPVKAHPVLFDAVAAQVQRSLANSLVWLRHSFGIAERIKVERNGKTYYFPNIYIGGGKYESILPDKVFGSYSFFTLGEPQEVSYEIGGRHKVKSNFSLIVWFDLRTTDDYDERNKEAVKQDILRVLDKRTFVRGGNFKIGRIYEKCENVFDGFTIDEVDNQLLVQPYCAFRFEGEMTAIEDCEL